MDDEQTENEGYVTAEWAMKRGIPFSRIREMESSGTIIKIDRGLYASPQTERDELFIIQHRYSKGVYSGITALMIHGLTDHRSENFYMTFPKGYNPSSIKNNDWHIEIKRVLPELYDLGITESVTEHGNVVKVYDRERTICDILRGHGISPYIMSNALKRYFRSGTIDIDKLRLYAEKLHVSSKIERYIEILE